MRDILVNIKEGDILLADTAKVSAYYSAVWGRLFDDDDALTLYCNVLVTPRDIRFIQFDGERCALKVHVPFSYFNSSFVIRLVMDDNGEYTKLSDVMPQIPELFAAHWYPAQESASQALNSTMLSAIDSSHVFIVNFTKYGHSAFNKAFFYSSKETDIFTGKSDDQFAQLLVLCGPGNFYRFPTAGIGISDFMYSVVRHTDLADKLQNEFRNADMTVLDASFDAMVGNLDIDLSGGETDDTALTPVENLDLSFLRIADDDYLRKILRETFDIDFSEYMTDLTEFGDVYGIYLFPDETTIATKLLYETRNGVINYDGSVSDADETRVIVNARIEAESVIFFNLPKYNYEELPGFRLLDLDGNLVYVDGVDTHYTTDSDIKRCAVILRNCMIEYGMSADDCQNESYGVFLLHNTAANFKNLASVVLDAESDEIQVFITENSNISDATIDMQTDKLLILKTSD